TINCCNKLFIFGDKEKHLIFGYYIVFGNVSFSSVLSDSYDEENFGYVYEEDPHTNQARLEKIEVPENFNPQITKDHPGSFHLHSEEMEKRIGNLFNHSMSEQQKKILESITTESLKTCMPAIGEIITHEHIAKLAKKVAEEFVKFRLRISTEEDITDLINNTLHSVKDNSSGTSEGATQNSN
ncbi:MAG: hypothetical protein JNJ47_07930, partial [Alphaproteobacteria bacterium]|nr:hypothetical protein [Alphaproteobacteria bacterium]